MSQQKRKTEKFGGLPIDFVLLNAQARVLGRVVDGKQELNLAEKKLLEGLWELCHAILDRRIK